MKATIVAAAFAALGLAASTGHAGVAETTAKPVCIHSRDIDHTVVPDSRTILFYMRGGKIWKNTLVNDCVGLKFDGFVYAPTPPDEICDNMQTIRVVRQGSVCMMGAFTPYTPPKTEPAH